MSSGRFKMLADYGMENRMLTSTYLEDRVISIMRTRAKERANERFSMDVVPAPRTGAPPIQPG